MAKPTHDHNGHRLRVKQRFLKEGNFDSFQPHNILEYLLFYTIPIRDTNELAHKLINEFGSLGGVFDARYEDLVKVDGIGGHTASLIKAILPMARAYMTDKEKADLILSGTDEAIKYLRRKYIGFTEEVFSIISMDNRCKVLSFDVLSTGSLSSVSVDNRKVLETILRTGASCVILAHNHPSGVALPSEGDVAATKNINIACSSVNVSVVDHIILTVDDAVSFVESRMGLEYFKKR